MDWINTVSKFPIGLKYPDSETYIEFSVYPELNKGLLNVIFPKNLDELFELLDPMIIRLIKEYDIKYLYQVISNSDFRALIDTKWKNLLLTICHYLNNKKYY